MTYNKFTLYIVIRILLILLNLLVISYLIDRGDLLYTLLLLSIIVIFQTIGLIQFVNKTNDELSKFILALRDTDYTAKFPKAKSESFELLFDRFQSTLEYYKSKETKYEAQFLFIQELIDNIETGILALDEDGKVVLINRVARQIRTGFRFEESQGLIAYLTHVNDSDIINGENHEQRKIKLLVNKSQFKLLDKTQIIYTFKDISSPLEAKEIESWQKLIRILAHEIINSLTPITSLSETTLLILKNNQQTKLEDIELSLRTIKERSEGLLHFMEDYRQLIKVPIPKPGVFDLKNKISGILHLFKGQLKDIEIIEEYESNTIYADPILFDQVLINLITNSIQALTYQPTKRIHLKCVLVQDYIIIKSRDNGCGMTPDALSKALIPFFTTKSNGSGIGLSLVQQIMNLHRGRIAINSVENQYTEVSLHFPIHQNL